MPRHFEGADAGQQFAVGAGPQQQDGDVGRRSPTCNWIASARPSATRPLPAVSDSTEPSTMARSQRRAGAVVARHRCRAGRRRRASRHSRGVPAPRRRAARARLRSRAARAFARSRSGPASAGAGRVAWAESASSRLRSSPSNPFMIDRIVMSAATPRQTPARETQLMNETKYWCWRARTYRSPSPSGSGVSMSGYSSGFGMPIKDLSWQPRQAPTRCYTRKRRYRDAYPTHFAVACARRGPAGPGGDAQHGDRRSRRRPATGRTGAVRWPTVQSRYGEPTNRHATVGESADHPLGLPAVRRVFRERPRAARGPREGRARRAERSGPPRHRYPAQPDPAGFARNGKFCLQDGA